MIISIVAKKIDKVQQSFKKTLSANQGFDHEYLQKLHSKHNTQG